MDGVNLAQRLYFNDLKEHGAGAGSVGVESVDHSLILDGHEADAGAGDGIGLGALFGIGGVHSQTVAVGQQVGLGLVLSQTQLQVVLVIQLLDGKDEVSGVGGAVGVGGAYQIAAGLAVDGVHQVVASDSGSSVVISNGGAGESVNAVGDGHGHYHHQGKNQQKQLFHK